MKRIAMAIGLAACGAFAAPFFVYAWLSRIWRITNMDGCVEIALGFDTKDGCDWFAVGSRLRGGWWRLHLGCGMAESA